MKPIPNYILLGHIVGVHGVRGFVKLHSECRPREQILEYSQLLLRNESNHETIKVTLSSGRVQGRGLVAKFSGYSDRDKAYGLVNHSIWVHRNQLPTLADDEFYWHDLIGLRVINLAQENIGIVDSLMETGANDVMIIKASHHEILIPFIMHHYIIEIDIESKTIIVDWHKDWSDPANS